MLEGVIFCELLNFWFWRVLIWRFCGHVPLRMCMMTQNGRFLFWQMAVKTPNLPNLTPSKISCCMVYMYMYVHMLLYMNSLFHFLMVKCMLVKAKSLICTLLYSLISILFSPSLLTLPLFLFLLLFSLSDWNSLRGSSYLLGLH